MKHLSVVLLVLVLTLTADHAAAIDDTVYLPTIQAWLAPPDIVFRSGRYIYRVARNGANLQQLTADVPIIGYYHNFDYQPDWSPSTGEIAFVRSYYKEGSPYVMNSDSSGQREFSYADCRFVAWSPDGARMAIELIVRSYPWGNRDLAILTTDGSPPVNISNTLEGPEEAAPSWSPDGSILIFDDGADLYTIKPDGSDRTQVTHSPDSVESSPVYSPDGTKVAYYEGRDGQIYVMDADGTAPHPITTDSHSHGAPDWSSQTNEIVVSTLVDDLWEMWIINPDTGDVVSTLRLDIDIEQPSWQY